MRIKVKSGFHKGPMTTRANNVTSLAKQHGLEEKIHATAVRLAEIAKGEIRKANPSTRAEADILTTYYDSLTVVDGGKDFTRRKYPAGTRIRVALVVPVGGAVSAQLAEYGSGSMPGFYPLTKALMELGGTDSFNGG